MKCRFCWAIGSFLILFCSVNIVFADYKIKQRMIMQGQTIESSVLVKGSRQRTESSGFMGMGADVATIEQCDLRRNVLVNDTKKLYFIEPFAADVASGGDVAVPVSNDKTTHGGIVTMNYNITDTGERKQMFGLTARHIKTTMTMEASPNACTKGDMRMETDGWYVDLPQFSCPVQMPNNPMMRGENRGGCQDQFRYKTTGGGKIGFPLSLTMTMGTGGNAFTQTIETIEFSNATLDAGLFDVPKDYMLAKSSQDLYGKPDMAAIMKSAGGNMGNTNDNNSASNMNSDSTPKKPGVIRIGVLLPTNKTSENFSADNVRSDLISKLSSGNVEAIEINSVGDAKNLSCDYVLSIDVTKLKQSTAGKIGGMFGKVTGVPTGEAGNKYEAQVDYRLMTADGQTAAQNQATKKDSGSAEEVTESALNQAVPSILSAVNQKK